MRDANLWATVLANRYCGYVSIAQIKAPVIKSYDNGVRSDRLEIGMTIRDIINGSEGEVREGYAGINAADLNGKERAEMAYKKIMKENGSFLDYRGLEEIYWLRNWLVENRCKEYDFSMWVKSLWSSERYMLEVSQFDRRDRVMTYGEWMKIFQGKMMFSRDDHNYAREGGLSAEMEAASEEVILDWCAKLGLDDNGGRVDTEVIELLDLTPTGPMDAMMVAEAVLSQKISPKLD